MLEGSATIATVEEAVKSIVVGVTTPGEDIATVVGALTSVSVDLFEGSLLRLLPWFEKSRLSLR